MPQWNPYKYPFTTQKMDVENSCKQDPASFDIKVKYQNEKSYNNIRKSGTWMIYEYATL